MTPTILQRLTSVRKNGSGWTARCPSHDDQRSSLSVSVGDDGRTLVHCHAGCPVEAVVSAAGLRMSDLAAPNGNGKHHGTSKPRIVAENDYRDEQGTLLYQAVRFEPKDFRQRRPGPGGGWVWNLDEVRRVLYQLPELIAADPGEWVLICEGEKDCDRLAAAGWVSTTNCGGAGKWRDEYSEHLRGRRVAILPDNDKPGRDHAAQVAASLQGVAAEIKVVQLPGLSPKGDVSDWLDNGGTQEQLAELIQQAPPWAPAAEPSFFDRVEVAKKQVTSKAPPQPWVPFPIKALPQPIQDYVVGSAEAIGCDPAAVATAILPALAAAIGNSRVLLLKPGWTEPSVLWGVPIGYSGDQKSPALDAGTKFVTRRQAAAFEAYQQARTVYDQEIEFYRLALDDWKKGGRKKGDPQPEAPIEPVCERCACSDVTVEGLAVILQHAPRLLAYRDELSGWICGFDQYKAGRGGADTAHWLTIHGARDLVVDRKTSGTVFVRRAAVSITGGIQPDTLRRVLGAEHFENGLAARLLLAYPPRRKKRWTEAAVDTDLDRRVEAVFEALYRLEPDRETGTPEPVVVGLSQHGKATWIEFYNRHAERIADATGNEAAVLSKIEGAAARIALVLHLVRQAAGDQDAGQAVDARSVDAGVRLAEWYGNEALRVYGLFAETDDDRQQRDLVEWIRRRGGTVTVRDLTRGPRQYRGDSEAAELALRELADAGIGSWDSCPAGDQGGRPTQVFRLATGDTGDGDETCPHSGKMEVVSPSPLSPAETRKTSSRNGDTGDGDETQGKAGNQEVVSPSPLAPAVETVVSSPGPDEAGPEGCDPVSCRGCRKLLIDREAKVVAEFHWLAGMGGGDYCKACYEAGRVVDTLTGRRIPWHGPDYKVGTSLADDEPEPSVMVCNHKDPETWVVRDGKAHCVKCDKYMGRLQK